MKRYLIQGGGEATVVAEIEVEARSESAARKKAFRQFDKIDAYDWDVVSTSKITIDDCRETQ